MDRLYYIKITAREIAAIHSALHTAIRCDRQTVDNPSAHHSTKRAAAKRLEKHKAAIRPVGQAYERMILDPRAITLHNKRRALGREILDSI